MPAMGYSSLWSSWHHLCSSWYHPIDQPQAVVMPHFAKFSRLTPAGRRGQNPQTGVFPRNMLNIAGNRERTNLGIYATTFNTLVEALK